MLQGELFGVFLFLLGTHDIQLVQLFRVHEGRGALVAASSISLAPPQAAGLARYAAAPLPNATAALGRAGGPG